MRFSYSLALMGLVLTSLPIQAETLTYEYDPNGNVLIRQSPSRLETEGYDALDRLKLDTSGDGLQREFSYDANGNRNLYQVGNFYESLSYTPNTNRLTTRGGQSIQTDAAGNITNDGQYQYIYNQRGQLKEIRQGVTLIASYAYEANGQRARKVTAQGTTLYHYDLQGHLISETTETGTPKRDYIYLEDRPIAQIDIQGTTETVTYIHTDHLNTPRLATNSEGIVVWSWNAEAFGSNLCHEDVDGDGLTTTINLRFPGQYFDQETGLFYNWNRYYDPRIGRYVTNDPIGLEGGFNTYTYGLNNPLYWIDPLGLVNAVLGGTVTRVGWEGGDNHNLGGGYRITITEPNGSSYFYGHMDPATVTLKKGDPVNAGDCIGDYATPTNGLSTGPHLHLQRRDSKSNIINPGNVADRAIPGGIVKRGYTGPEGHPGIDIVKPKNSSTCGCSIGKSAQPSWPELNWNIWGP